MHLSNEHIFWPLPLTLASPTTDHHHPASPLRHRTHAPTTTPHNNNNEQRQAGARRIFNPFVTVRPAYFKLTISDASQPFTQPIAGVTAPAGSTVTYVRVIYTSGVLSAAPSADAGGIDLTILDLARFPDPTTKIPVIVSYTVRGPTGGVGVGEQSSHYYWKGRSRAGGGPACTCDRACLPLAGRASRTAAAP